MSKRAKSREHGAEYNEHKTNVRDSLRYALG